MYHKFITKKKITLFNIGIYPIHKIKGILVYWVGTNIFSLKSWLEYWLSLIKFGAKLTNECK